MKTILNLTIHRRWFDMIASGKTCDGKCEAVRKAKAALAKAGGEE